MLPHVLLALIAPLLALASDDGGITGATSSAEAAGYSCDASKCKLPNCNCASTSECSFFLVLQLGAFYLSGCYNSFANGCLVCHCWTWKGVEEQL
jgi:hypothetical protein